MAAGAAADRYIVYQYGTLNSGTQQTDKKMYQGSNSSGTLLEQERKRGHH